MSLAAIDRRSRALMLGIGALLTAVYGLSYSGLPTADDEQLFIAVAQNLAIDGGFRSPQLFGSSRLTGGYEGIGLPHVLAGFVPVKLARTFGLGQVQAAYLLPIIYTILTACTLMLFARSLGHSRRAMALGGLAYGLGTIAWPYSTAFFRESLAALFLLAAWFAFEKATSRRSPPAVTSVSWWSFLVLFALAILTKLMILAAAPAFLFLAWQGVPRDRDRRWIWPLIAVLAIALVLIVLPKGDSTGPEAVWVRLSPSFAPFVADRLLSLRPAAVLGAVAGSLVSPGRGLLIYSPILWLLPAALLAGRGRRRVHWLLPLFTTGGMILGQALAYGQHWWSPSWSVRYLLPVIPLNIMLLLPLLEGDRPGRNPWVVAWLLLTSLGTVLQLPAILGNPARLTAELSAQLGPDSLEQLWGLPYAPGVRLWGQVVQAVPWRPLLAQTLFEGSPLPSVTLLLAAILLGLGVRMLVRSRRAAHDGSDRQGRPAVAIVAIAAALSIALLLAGKLDPRYGGDRPEVETARSMLCDRARASDQVLVQPYPSETWRAFFNWNCLETNFYSLPLRPLAESEDTGDTPVGLASWELMQRVSEGADRVWLALDGRILGDEPTPEMNRLDALAELKARWEFSSPKGQVSVRLYAGDIP